MRVIFFDLGNTLVDSQENLLPGALEMLHEITKLRDLDGAPVELGLISDYKKAATAEESERVHQEYYQILEKVGLAQYFSPFDRRVTLSTKVGFYKPDRQIFEAALAKYGSEAHFHHSVFITEHEEHIAGARKLGMMAIHFKGPGQVKGEVDKLTDLVPILHRLLVYSSCCKKQGDAVGRYKSQLVQSKNKDDTISVQIDKVSESRLRKSIELLGNFGSRWSYTVEIEQVSEWIHEQFTAMGYSASGGGTLPAIFYARQ